MSSSITHVIEVWKQLNYPELLRDLDRSVTDVAKRQDESDISRKRLVELSREYKRNTHEDIRRPVAPLLKKFQTEIDDLSKRAKSVEAVLLDVFKRLIDLPDPVVALEVAMTIQKKMQRMQDLEIENKQLRETLDEYNTEFADVKNQEVTIKQLKEKIRELEGEAEEAISTRVRERERGLATRYADLERELNERHMEVAAKLRETELKTKTLQTALENTQTELIELKLRYEEVTAAKTDEIDMLVSDMEKANERASSAERQASELQVQLEQRRMDGQADASRSPGPVSESAEEAMRRAELELELNSKEKEISQLVEEVRRLQSTLKQSQESNSLRVNRLEEELKQKSDELIVLESRVSAREDYDEVKHELDVLRAIEFNTEGAAAADGGEPGRPKPLEQLLVEKNKALQNEVTQLKVANQQHVDGFDQLKSQHTDAVRTIDEQRQLIRQLEEDLGKVKAVSALFRGSAEGQDSANVEAEALASAIDGDKGIVGSDASLLPIVQSQRERFRVRAQELEAHSLSQQQQIQFLQTELDKVRTDNVKLYEKIKFLHSYAGKNQSDDRTMTRYSDAYESRLDPFISFSKKERVRKYQDLKAYDKITLSLGRFIMGNPLARLIALCYTLMLHLLVFLVLYKIAHTESCKRDVAADCTRRFAEHMNKVHGDHLH